MLGESVVVSGGGGTTLLRPLSADNLSRLAPASSIPALDDLAESEVFVGDEDDDIGEARQNGEVYLRSPHLPLGDPGNVSPELLSPTGPVPTTNLVITYHEDALRLPLDAVKEEVEAEALEEASMIMSSGPGSLSHVSLTSSIISTASLDDSTLSSRTDTYDTVIAAVRSPTPPETSPTSPKPTSSRPVNKDTARVSGTPTRTSPTSPRGSSGRSSPRTSTDTPNTPERRRKAPGVAASSPRSEGSGSRGSTPRGTQRTSAQHTRGKTDEKKTPRGLTRGTSVSADRKPCLRAQEGRKDKHTLSHTRSRGMETVEEPKTSTLGRRKKTETKDTKSEAEAKPTVAFRRKKETKTEKEEVVEKYGTLGRRKKAKEAPGDITKEDKSLCKDDKGMTKDTKNTLDMYATLPRRRAKEMSARWREQMAAEEEATSPSLRRTKSVGKSEGAAAGAAVRGSGTRSRNSIMTSSLPPSALRPRSPRCALQAKSTSTTNLTPRKEKTIICMEVGIQTSLTGVDVISAMRALSRQNSLGTEESDDTSEARPHVPIVREVQTPEEQPDSRSVEVQVELAWRLGEGELPEHVRRLTEEHTRLQNEHSRAMVRLEEMEGLKEELQRMRVSLEDEKTEKEEVQGELDRTSQRVKDMLISMEGVEHEFNSRGDSLMELESQLHHSADIHSQMQERLNKFEDSNLKMKRDLDKSMAAQKALLQQVHDLENEGREMADFMAEEKNALAECLREAEIEMSRLRKECQQLSTRIKEKEEEIRRVTRVAEERNKYMQLQTDMSSMQCRTRDMMVCQGAEVSGAAVALTNVSSRLQALIGRLVQDYSITEADLEMIVTPSESDSSASSTNGTPEHKPAFKCPTRHTPSPRKTTSFMTALLSAMRMGPKPKLGGLGAFSSFSNGSNKQVTEGRNSPEGSESHEVVEGSGGGGSMTLTDQVTEMDVFLTKFLKVCCVLKNETDMTLSEIEDENDRLSNQVRSQQQVIDQQHADYETLTRSEARAKKELTTTKRELELANEKLEKYYEAEYDLQVMKLQDEVERLGTTVRHLEALHGEKERQLAEALSLLSSAQGSAPANHVSEASHYEEVSNLSDKVTSLRQSVIERDRRINELSERHSQDLSSLRETQGQAQRSAHQLTTTVEHVMKTLEGIPDIVSGSPALKELFNTLAATTQSTQQQQQNGNLNTQNGFLNTVNNKDLNANPQSIINTAVNNKKLISNLSAETHL